MSETLFDRETWAALREGCGLSLECTPCRWMDIERLYEAELAWALYRERPAWAEDPELGERSNRCIFFALHDDDGVPRCYFVPKW